MYKKSISLFFLLIYAIFLFGQKPLDGVYENRSSQIKICIKEDSVFYLRQTNGVKEYYYGTFSIKNNTLVFNHNIAYNYNTIIDTCVGTSQGMEIELIELQKDILFDGKSVEIDPYEARSTLWGVIYNDIRMTIKDTVAIFYPNDFKHEKEVELIITGGMMSGYLDIVKLSVVFGRRYVLTQQDTKYPLLEGSYPFIEIRPNCRSKIKCYDNKTGKLKKMKRTKDCISCSSEMKKSLLY